MNTLLINISRTENNFLEKKAVECGCTREEFIDLLITRDMESDCRYYERGSCTIQNKICETEDKGGWLNGSLCDVCIDHERDLEILEKTRY